MSLTQNLIQRTREWEIDLITIGDARPVHTKTYLVSRETPYRCGQRVHTEVEVDVFDPKVVLPTARSVVMLGVYTCGLDTIIPTTPDTPRGKIGPWTRIYSYLSEQMGDIVIEFLAERGFRSVFTNDLPYRAIAAQTGMGKISRNHFLYTKEFGSYIRLSCVVTDAPLETTYTDYDFTANECGSCRICERNCPTRSMCEDGTYLYDQCLHQLLQGKGDAKHGLPRKYWGVTESYLMRTGKCLEICRLNRNLVPRQSIPRFVKVFPEIDLPDSPELIPIVMATDAEMEKIVPYNCWKYGKNHIRQNAILALGQQKAKNAVNVLEACVNTCEHPLNARMAAWSLGEIGTIEARQALEKALKAATSEELQEELRNSLSKFSKE